MNYSVETKKLLQDLTLEEKAVLLTGKNEWESFDIPAKKIPSITCSDGPSGVRRQLGAGDHLGLNPSIPATCFPSAATVANSWDETLAEEVGEALGEEAVSLGVEVLLGPGLNIKRSPLCGRNFEYFSEDPYLSGKLAAAYIRGIQSKGIAACPKHFAVNSQEERRMSMNAVVDERTLREIYLTGFEIAVKEGNARAIMTSYNEVNGVYANENTHLLRDILRGEWGFEGMVITDWGGSNDHVAGVKAGSNLEMPATGMDSALQLVKAYHAGKISMTELDNCVGTLLETIARIKRTDKRSSGDKVCAGSSETLERHHKLAERAAAESIVLLKNREKILPLKSGEKVVVIGDFASQTRYQGAGSSSVECTKLESVCDLIQEYPLSYTGYAQGYRRDRKMDGKLELEALTLAKEAEKILFFFGLDEISEAEGMDRSHIKLPENQLQLLEKLAEQGKKVIGILSGGSVVEMNWENNCCAILHTYLGGQAGAGAVMKVLTGQINPSGKLNETYPLRCEDNPSAPYYPAKGRNSQYREGLYVGYRYYGTAGVKVRYPFGYGLSYTEFQYSELSVIDAGAAFTIKNIGDRAGAEVVQLYIGCQNGKVFRPVKELKGFRKVFLKAGEERRITIPLDDKAFRYWNTEADCWAVEAGTYQVMIGSSSEDIRLSGELQMTGSSEQTQDQREYLPSYYSGKIHQVSAKEYSALLGHSIPIEQEKRELTVNDALCRMKDAKSFLARLAWSVLEHLKKQGEKKGKPDLNVLFIYNIPFRGIAKMTEGLVTMEMAEGLVTAVNGHLFRGIGGVIRGYFRNRRESREFRKKLGREE